MRSVVDDDIISLIIGEKSMKVKLKGLRQEIARFKMDAWSGPLQTFNFRIRMISRNRGHGLLERSRSSDRAEVLKIMMMIVN